MLLSPRVPTLPTPPWSRGVATSQVIPLVSRPLCAFPLAPCCNPFFFFYLASGAPPPWCPVGVEDLFMTHLLLISLRFVKSLLLSRGTPFCAHRFLHVSVRTDFLFCFLMDAIPFHLFQSPRFLQQLGGFPTLQGQLDSLTLPSSVRASDPPSLRHSASPASCPFYSHHQSTCCFEHTAPGSYFSQHFHVLRSFSLHLPHKCVDLPF